METHNTKKIKKKNLKKKKSKKKISKKKLAKEKKPKIPLSLSFPFFSCFSWFFSFFFFSFSCVYIIPLLRMPQHRSVLALLLLCLALAVVARAQVVSDEDTGSDPAAATGEGTDSEAREEAYSFQCESCRSLLQHVLREKTGAGNLSPELCNSVSRTSTMSRKVRYFFVLFSSFG
jgi:hypothetical protein